MDGRGVVNDNPEAVAALLTVLRAHDVAKYERDASGALRVEFYAPAPAKAPPLFAQAPGAVATDDMETPTPAAEARLSTLPATDPLFDGVGGTP